MSVGALSVVVGRSRLISGSLSDQAFGQREPFFLKMSVDLLEEPDARFLLEEVIEREELIEENGAPEDALEAGFGGFMAEVFLGEEGTGPAAEEGDEVEGVLLDAPVAFFGLPFIAGVEMPCQPRSDEHDGRREPEGCRQARTCGERKDEENGKDDPVAGGKG